MSDGILIIEDNPVQRQLVRTMLASFMTCDIFEAADHDQAMALLTVHPVDVVLCDIGLPGVSGLDTAAEIIDHYDHIAVVMLTANEDPDTSRKAIDLGACAYLVKPVAPGQLRITIARAVKIREYKFRIQRQETALREKIRGLEQTRLALEQSRDEFKALFENIQEGFYRADLDGQITMVNPVVAEMMGYASSEEILGMPMTAFYRDPLDRETFLKALFQSGSVSAYEIRTRRRDGSLGHVLVNAHLRYDGQGEVLGTEGTMVDISHRKRLEQDLAQSQKLESIGQLAAGIAHEINTPIQYVGDNTAFLRDAFRDLMTIAGEAAALVGGKGVDGEGDAGRLASALEEADLEFLEEEVPAAIRQSLDGVDRVSRIVRSMKAFSHPGGDAHEPADINQLIETTVVVARSEWKYVAELATDLHPLPRINCNPAELNQVFLNLLINASHAVADTLEDQASGKGTIIIETRDLSDAVEIRIKDNGSGIPEAVRDRIFDPFFTTKKLGKGSGQGLAIARSVVVDKHRGKLWVDSGSESGTCFYIRLPKDGPKGGES
ncbi:MAG: response regulator [Desulfobacterales bacterium]|nr:response regulator [Desulfobacterales bacterium]